MTKLQKENLEHTEASLQVARTRLQKAELVLKDKASSLEYALKQEKEAAAERAAAEALLNQARSRFFNVVDEIEPMPGPHIFGKPVITINQCTERPF